MNIFRFLMIIVCVFNNPVLAQNARGVPKQLFGIDLGGVYDIGEEGETGNLPIMKFTGMNRFLGQGIHYYFQPLKEIKAFEYVEKKESPDDEYFTTSYRLYLLPVIPSTVKNKEELEDEILKWEVGLIEWSNDAKTKDDAYYWAMDLCKTFNIDISVEPEIINNYESKLYVCTFSEDDREFEVSSFYSKSIKLSNKREISDKKEKVIEDFFRKLEANEIRPY